MLIFAYFQVTMDKLKHKQDNWDSRKLYRVFQDDTVSSFTFIIFTFLTQYKSTVFNSVMILFIKYMIQNLYAFLGRTR